MSLLLSQNSSHRTCTSTPALPSSQHHLYFLYLFPLNSQISSLRVSLTPKTSIPGIGDLKFPQTHPKFFKQGADLWDFPARNPAGNARKSPGSSPGRGDPWHCSQSGSHLAMIPRSTGHDSAPVANIEFSAAVAERKGRGKI